MNQLKNNPRTTIGRIGKVLEAIRNTTPEAPDVKPVEGEGQWKSRVRALVERIIAPDCVDWMEDDAKKDRYANRALSYIRKRFERFVPCVYYQFESSDIRQ